MVHFACQFKLFCNSPEVLGEKEFGGDGCGWEVVVWTALLSVCVGQKQAGLAKIGPLYWLLNSNAVTGLTN